MWLWSSRSRVSLFWKPRCTYLDEKEVSKHALHAVNKEVSVSPWYRWASERVRETKIYDTGRPLIILKNPYRTLQACFLVTCLKTPEENQSIKEDRVSPMAIKVGEQLSIDVSGRRRQKKLLTDGSSSEISWWWSLRSWTDQRRQQLNSLLSPLSRFVQILPSDAMRKLGLRCRPVCVRPSVRSSRSCIVSRWIKILSSFFLDPVAPSI